jgi:hypothetical protein
MVSFATTVGFGGRNGLRPREQWFEVAKLQTLALRQVAAETGVGTLWSWGWATWTPPEQDADKPDAACVWLWARSPSLCNGPAAAGRHFDRSRSEGQINLGTDVQCRVGTRGISNDAIQRLQLMTGDRDTAFTAVYERLVESGHVAVSARQVLAAEREVVEQHFHGDRSAYAAALGRAHATVTIARAILADELRRAALLRRIRAGAPSGADVATFYDSYPDMQVRPVSATPAPAWLGGRKRGLALSALAPDAVFTAPTGHRLGVLTAGGASTVRTLGDTVPLGSLPLGSVRGAIADALRHFAKADAYDRWTQSLQAKALDTAVCARDDLPQPGSVDLTEFLPFLQLGA